MIKIRPQELLQKNIWLYTSIFCVVCAFVACRVSVRPDPNVSIVEIEAVITYTPSLTETPSPIPVGDSSEPAEVIPPVESNQDNPPAPTFDPLERTLPAFDQFIEKVKNGVAGQVVGLWVENKLSLKVVYQPETNPAFVSSIDNVATYFLLPYQKAGNHGLLAHNYLAGRYFYDLVIGDVIQLVYGDGYYEDFEITEIKDFQALEPNSPYSNFIDLASGEQLTATNLFIGVYFGPYHSTLQTCLTRGNNTEWGRHFTLAPLTD